MKKVILILSLACFYFNVQAQYKGYSINNSKETFKAEELLLTLTESNLDTKAAPLVPKVLGGLATVGTQFVNLAFKIGTDLLEKRAKKFAAEYTAQNSYLKAGNQTIPNMTFTRKVDNKNALTIVFKAKFIDNTDSCYCYCVESIDLDYSKAKTTNKSRLFDYIIELKPVFLTKGKKNTPEINPIKINSVGFGKISYENCKYRSSIISLPEGGLFSDVAIKITETNPIKVDAEKVLATYNKYKDDTKTIVNNFISKD